MHPSQIGDRVRLTRWGKCRRSQAAGSMAKWCSRRKRSDRPASVSKRTVEDWDSPTRPASSDDDLGRQSHEAIDQQRVANPDQTHGYPR
jgi:hypothetical protein